FLSFIKVHIADKKIMKGKEIKEYK
mgnify:CR=1